MFANLPEWCDVYANAGAAVTSIGLAKGRASFGSREDAVQEV
ncbi:hypothetical protein [Rhizobium mongolense]